MSFLRFARLLAVCGAVPLAACSTYVVPGRSADMGAFMPAQGAGAATGAPDGAKVGNVPPFPARVSLGARPTASFPASIAVVRVQAPSYTNYRLRQPDASFGGGRYTIVLTREVGEQDQVDRVLHLPQVAGITGLNRMLLPTKLEGDREIREAAARLQADMVFIYTFDTSFHDTDDARPLTVVTLGLSPTRRITVTTTVSALLLDTKTGYVYATSEATKTSETRATSWGSGDAADEVRRHNEHDAFAQLVDDFAKSWPALVDRYQKKDGRDVPAG